MYLKYGHVQGLYQKIEGMVNSRIYDLAIGKKRPVKSLNSERKWEKKFEEIYSQLSWQTSELYKNVQRVEDRWIQACKISFGTIFKILFFQKIFDFEDFEVLKLFWIIVDRQHDPEMAVIRFIRAYEKKGYIMSPFLSKKMATSLAQKLNWEITKNEFLNILLFMIAKQVNIYP